MRQKLLYSITVVAVALVLIFFSRSTPVVLLRSGVIWTFRPVFKVVSVIGHGLGAGAQPSSGSDLSKLAAENGRLRKVEQQYQMLQDKNADLQKMLGFKEKQHVPLQGARVLLHGNEFGKEFLMLDAGTDKKIHEGDLVIDNKENVVGIIREAGSQSSKVSLASNVGEAFEVAMAPLNVKALAKGIGNRTFSLALIPDETPVRSGDFAFMPGRLGTIDAAVAMVTHVTSSGVGAFQNVQGTLIVHPEMLDEVFIIVE